MAAVVVMVLLMAMIRGSDAAWCVCKSDQSSTSLQKTLDYACGAGADCSPILQNGVCYNPNTVLAHCNYAANSYYQRKGQAQQACDFAGTATLTSTDPSATGCSYPSTTSAAGTSTTTTPTTPSTGATTGTTPSTFSPPTGTGTGVLGGLGPSGNSISTDSSDGGFPSKARIGSLLLTIMFPGMALLRS